VARAGNPAEPGARAALAELCTAYWFPLYAFVRRKGHGPHEAEDLVQGLFADLLDRGELAAVDRARGRFRAFLRAACSHYLANCRDHDHALKRGGGVTIISIDRVGAEARYARGPAHGLTAERLFERQWALTLLARVLKRLDAESGGSPLFARLRPLLQGDSSSSYRAVGESLGMTEGAVRVAAHRLRARYRELLREEVARTTDNAAAVDDEIAGLLAALAKK
jgi:RNA polymerase sigma-70 factor (ECF subfamily)